MPKIRINVSEKRTNQFLCLELSGREIIAKVQEGHTLSFTLAMQGGKTQRRFLVQLRKDPVLHSIFPLQGGDFTTYCGNLIDEKGPIVTSRRIQTVVGWLDKCAQKGNLPIGLNYHTDRTF